MRRVHDAFTLRNPATLLRGDHDGTKSAIVPVSPIVSVLDLTPCCEGEEANEPSRETTLLLAGCCHRRALVFRRFLSFRLIIRHDKYRYSAELAYSLALDLEGAQVSDLQSSPGSLLNPPLVCGHQLAQAILARFTIIIIIYVSPTCCCCCCGEPLSVRRANNNGFHCPPPASLFHSLTCLLPPLSSLFVGSLMNDVLGSPALFGTDSSPDQMSSPQTQSFPAHGSLSLSNSNSNSYFQPGLQSQPAISAAPTAANPSVGRQTPTTKSSLIEVH